MTEEERKLWYCFLQKLPITIRRQKMLGQYIADFYCAAAKLVIEIDGSQHYEDYGTESDKKRDSFLQEQGITVLRYSNIQINQEFDSVCQDIALHLTLE